MCPPKELQVPAIEMRRLFTSDPEKERGDHSVFEPKESLTKQLLTN